MILKNNKRIDGCSDTVPVGTLNPFLGTIAPYGYLICQGQKVSKITYKELYKICGDTFGQSTDTEFYLPDLRGQTIAGYKEGDSTFGTLGGLIGSLTHLHSTGNHTLTVDEMPSHTHFYRASIGAGNAEGSLNFGDISGGVITGQYGNAMQSSGGSQSHNHGDTFSTSSIQPTIVLNWIVKAFQLMPNQSYVSTVNQESDTNTYSCNYINDKIVPTGGTTGQVLAKKSNTDNDTEWVNQTGNVVDNLTGNSTTNAPSQRAVKEYIKDTYSTEEVKTNKIWIDGKPIYRKVVTGTINATGNNQVILTGNIDSLIDYSGYINDPAENLKLIIGKSTYIDGGSSRIIQISNSLYIGYANNYHNLNFYAVVEYTKTTDV